MTQNILVLLAHDRLSGVNTFQYTLISKLVELGNNIHVRIQYKECINSILYTKFENMCSTIGYHENIDTLYLKKYDKIFANYNTYCPNRENLYNIHTKLNFFVHGLMDDRYIPPMYSHKIFVMGERSHNYFINNGYKNLYLIRNVVDTSRFKYSPPNRDHLKNVLLFSSRDNGFLSSIFLKICNRMGLYLSVVGGDNVTGPIWDVEKRIVEADMVVGYGRCLYESMSMGKPVLCYGINGGDGYVTYTNFSNMLETNCSGWSLKSLKRPHEETIDNIILELENFNISDGIINSELIRNSQMNLENKNFLKHFVNYP